MNIPDKQLYREVILTEGKYKGTHRIYWNNAIYKLFERGTLVKWGDCLNAKAGDWIESQDGTILQLLDKRIYKDKSQRQFYFFRFAVTTVVAYIKTSGEVTYRQFFGNFMTAAKTSLKLNSIPGTTSQKAQFVAYLISGLNPLRAYRLAFGVKTTQTIATLHRKVKQLMNDLTVQKEIKNQLEPIVKALEKEFTPERFAAEISRLVNTSRPGSMAHRENIEFLMRIMGKLPEIGNPKKKHGLIEDAQYQEELPPPNENNY